MTLVAPHHSLPKTAVQFQINQIINQVLILHNHILHNDSSQLYLFHPHRSQHIHIPHPKDYPLVTTQSPSIEVFKNYFTWMKKNNNNLTKQYLTHLHFFLLHLLIHLIMHHIPITCNQHFPFQLQKYKLPNLLHNPLSQLLYTTLYLINKVYVPEIGYRNITPFTQD